MNTTRNGKIAQLPHLIRENINTLLRDGEQAAPLLVWLNSLPEVRELIASRFGGIPIREQNLSEWRKGGYSEWLAQQEAMDAVRRVNKEALALLPAGDLTDNVALWLTARYLAFAQRMIDENGSLDWKTMREFCGDLVALRRGDHSASRLLVEQKELALHERELALKEHFTKDRYKRSVIVGLNTLVSYTKANPEAKAAYEQLLKHMGDPFEPMFDERYEDVILPPQEPFAEGQSK